MKTEYWGNDYFKTDYWNEQYWGAKMSIRYNILQEIVSVLEDITIVNGFNTDVAFVSDNLSISHPEELDANKLPACFPRDESEEKEPLALFGGAGEDMLSTLEITITSIIYNKGGVGNMLERTDLIQDIEKAMVTDAGLLALLLELPSPGTVEVDEGYFGDYSVFKQSFVCQYTYNHEIGG